MERFFVKIKNNVYFKVDNFLAVIAEFLSQSYGFDVYAGEKDSFGWLTGCIEFPDGRVLVYG